MTQTLSLSGFNESTPIDVLGIGVFDGFHRGHQEISAHCDALLSFHPHPALVLGKKQELCYLTLPQELDFFVKHLIVLEFSETVSKFSAEEFLEDVILNTLRPKKIVVGYDFKFGYQQKGTVDFLHTWCDDHGILFEAIQPYHYNDQLVKSSYIRKLLLSDQFNTAIDFLGHDYPITGTVIKGDGRGKRLGFPTANLRVPEKKLLPSTGVYSGHVVLDKTRYPAGIYIGDKPTFEGSELSIEVHIIDFDGDLYDKPLTVFLSKKIRDELKFESAEDLIAQISQDLGSSIH